MMPSFRKRSTDRDAARSNLFAGSPFLIKTLLLSLVLGFLFLFRIGVEKGGMLSPPTPASSSPAPFLAATAVPQPPPAGPSTETVRVDLNTASIERIETLPGIGPKIAAEIVRHRTEQGPFHRPEELLRVRGIGPKKLSRIEPYLVFQSNDVEDRKKN